jgi:hypothetical protein
MKQIEDNRGVVQGRSCGIGWWRLGCRVGIGGRVRWGGRLDGGVGVGDVFGSFGGGYVG